MFGQRHRYDKCGRCALIARVQKEISVYLTGLRPEDVTAHRLFRPVPDEEIVALATCDNGDTEAQATMDMVIVRETARIRADWNDEEYYKRLHATHE